ncbi:MAG: lytic transglycosylase domain-containing protein [Chloroflexi bacterium]|nr:lytic transglycosylase domain-containing protein [Chloroflexota bacterium]
MTIYENTMGNAYQIVESPLSDYFDPPYPSRQPTISQGLRMLIILGFVTLVVITAVLFRPKLISGATVEASTSNESTVQTTDSKTGEMTGLAAAGADIEGGISPVFSPQVQYWEPQIVAWAEQFDLDPDIAATIMQIESCGDPKAASHAGAQGLFQVMPFHFDAGEAMLDPDTNARRGLAYYAERLQQTGGNIFLAFAGYNGGHVAAAGNWNSWANETQRYYTWSKGIYEDAKSGQSESATLQQWMQAGGASLCQQASSRLNLQ